MATVAATVTSNRGRPWLLPLAGAAHLALSVGALMHPSADGGHRWLVLDPPGRIVLLQVSVLYLLCAFLSAVSLVTWSHHLGLMWVGIETTTLVTAPLIYFNRTQRSIEATWKYLVVGSVGIALALLGTLFLAYAALHGGLESTLTFEDLLRHASQLSRPWLHAAMVLLLVGYGTKMGLAPMHTWKPDAYGEAPGVVGAILAGGVTSCAFLALLRLHHICAAAGETAYVSRLFVAMGILSMAVAGVFLIGQRDFKRLLAYSSVEHMGILALGLGIGAPALFGTLLHVITNGMTKGVLFLSAGNIHRAYASKTIDQVHGAIRRLPVSGALFLAGFLAITGSPPFGPFASMFSILGGAFEAGRFAVAGIFLVLLLVVFIGMGATVLQVVQGRPPAQVRQSAFRDGWLTAAPVVLAMALVLLLGLHLPGPLADLLNDAVRYLEVRP